jgi:hypothetical protein
LTKLRDFWTDTPEAPGLLSHVLQSPDALIRAAILSETRWRDLRDREWKATIVPILQKAACDRVEFVRKAAVEALQQIDPEAAKRAAAP